MDLTIFGFLIVVAIILYVLSRLEMGWIRMSFSWLSGGLMLVLALTVFNGESLTSVTTNGTIVPLALGVGTEPLALVLLLIGVVFVFSDIRS